MALEDAGNVETRPKYEFRKNQRHVSLFSLCMWAFLIIHSYSPIQASIICLFNGVHCRQRKQNFSLITKTMYFRALPKCPNVLKDGREDYKSFLCIRNATSAVCSVSVKAGSNCRSFKCLHDSPRQSHTLACVWYWHWKYCTCVPFTVAFSKCFSNLLFL